MLTQQRLPFETRNWVLETRNWVLANIAEQRRVRVARSEVTAVSGVPFQVRCEICDVLLAVAPRTWAAPVCVNPDAEHGERCTSCCDCSINVAAAEVIGWDANEQCGGCGCHRSLHYFPPPGSDEESSCNSCADGNGADCDGWEPTGIILCSHMWGGPHGLDFLCDHPAEPNGLCAEHQENAIGWDANGSPTP